MGCGDSISSFVFIVCLMYFRPLFCKCILGQCICNCQCTWINLSMNETEIEPETEGKCEHNDTKCNQFGIHFRTSENLMHTVLIM